MVIPIVSEHSNCKHLSGIIFFLAHNISQTSFIKTNFSMIVASFLNFPQSSDEGNFNPTPRSALKP